MFFFPLIPYTFRKTQSNLKKPKMGKKTPFFATIYKKLE